MELKVAVEPVEHLKELDYVNLFLINRFLMIIA